MQHEISGCSSRPNNSPIAGVPSMVINDAAIGTQLIYKNDDEQLKCAIAAAVS
jgi:hypothetical protein